MNTKLKPYLTKRNAIILLLAAVLVIAGYFAFKKFYKPSPIHTYEALIAVRNQFNPDPVEDLRTSLKAGDVLLTLPEGHSWSQTERVSYLILKMRLTEDQAQTLVSPEEKKAVELKPKTEEEKKQAEERKKTEGDRDRMETVRARRYRIMIEKLDPNFDPNILLEKQPYLDKIYDWNIVEKKSKVKN